MFPIFLIQIILVLLVVGVLLWGISRMPIDPQIYNFIRVAIVVVVAIWLIWLLASVLGVGLTPMATPRLH